jgi:hypothetical protein
MPLHFGKIFGIIALLTMTPARVATSAADADSTVAGMMRSQEPAPLPLKTRTCFFSWVMLKCNGFASFTTRLDALLRWARS